MMLRRKCPESRAYQRSYAAASSCSSKISYLFCWRRSPEITGMAKYQPKSNRDIILAAKSEVKIVRNLRNRLSRTRSASPSARHKSMAIASPASARKKRLPAGARRYLQLSKQCCRHQPTMRAAVLRGAGNRIRGVSSIGSKACNQIVFIRHFSCA